MPRSLRTRGERVTYNEDALAKEQTRRSRRTAATVKKQPTRTTQPEATPTRSPATKRRRPQQSDESGSEGEASNFEEEPETESESDSSEAFSDSDEEERTRTRRRRKGVRAKTTQSKAPPRKLRVKANIGNRVVHRVNVPHAIGPLPQRVVQRNEPATAYELARERLHVSAVPDSLPCREMEFSEIMDLLEGAIEAESGTCIYISGIPGTGKTATVLEVIRHLQYKSEQKELPAFDFVEINGMKLTNPSQAYNILYDCLEKDPSKKARVTSSHALQLLEAKLESSKDQTTTVVLLDELDQMVTRKQEVMYNFFEWPNRPASKLIIVAIANTMDLPEKMLTNKISSRLGLSRLNFQPYTHQQLYQIVESRLQGIDAFEKEAVEFAARKVSAVSGDARRALDICRRAVEIVESRQNDLVGKNVTHVTIGIIMDAIKEMLASPFVAFIQSCSFQQKLFLISVMQSIRRTGLGDVEFGDVAFYHNETCKWHHLEAPTTSELMHICESLGQPRVLVVEGGRLDLNMRITLNVDEADVLMGCKEDPTLSRLLVEK